MIVVIACAGGKDNSAGQLKTKNKQRVMFVAKPRKVPKNEPGIYKHPYKYRDKKQDIYKDFKKLPSDTRKPIVFLGGDSYVSLFGSLTEHIKTKRIIFHKSKNPTKPPNCQLRHFESKTGERIWYYECAKELMAENIDIA